VLYMMMNNNHLLPPQNLIMIYVKKNEIRILSLRPLEVSPSNVFSWVLDLVVSDEWLFRSSNLFFLRSYLQVSLLFVVFTAQSSNSGKQSTYEGRRRLSRSLMYSYCLEVVLCLHLLYQPLFFLRYIRCDTRLSVFIKKNKISTPSL
jgi:hypothetical protein